MRRMQHQAHIHSHRTGRAPRHWRLLPLVQAIAAAGLMASPLWLQAAPPAATALPTGLQVTAGQASVLTQGQQMTVRNSNGAILNWNSFNIGAAAGVHFDQANAASKVLNRVTGNDPSQIFGGLTSNGQVWLLNPSGVLFGQGARVDVAGLVSSTLRLNDNNFLTGLTSGRYRFTGDTGSTAAVRNESSIKSAHGGQVVMLGARVENTGSVQAPGGNVTLAAARSVELVDTGLPNLAVRVGVPDGETLNLGRLVADGGSVDVFSAIVNQQGLVQADTLALDARGRVTLKASDTLMLGTGSLTLARGLGASGAGGAIHFDAGELAHLEGSTDVSAASGKGGDLRVTGRQILLGNSAALDASGSSGGGTIRVGGDFQGIHPEATRHADMVAVAKGARLMANATAAGDGGLVVVWSDKATRFAGQADARGGALSGDGGMVEVSSKGYLDFRGGSDRSAPMGREGTLLLDPTNLTINSGPADINDDGTTGDDLTSPTLAFAAPGSNSVITASAVTAQLATGAVTLQATNNLTVSAAISSGSANALTLQAGNNLLVNAGISTGGAITLSANDPSGPATGSGAVTQQAALQGSAITISNNGGSGVHALGANITAGTLNLVGDAQLTASNIWTLTGTSTVSSNLSGAGALTKVGSGTLSLSGSTAYAGTTALGDGTLNFQGAGQTLASLTMTGGTLGGTGNVTVSGAFNVTGSSAAIDGTGTFTTQGTSTINLANVVGGVVDLRNGRTWVNTGNLTLAGDDFIQFGFPAGIVNTLTNALGGTINVTTTSATPFQRTVNTSVFNNAGTLNKSAAGTQSIGFDTFAGTSFNNTGTVNVSAGTLRVDANGTDAGAYNIASGASLDFVRGTRNLNTGSSISSLGSLTISGATVNFNGTSTTTLSSLRLTAGTLGGTGDVTIVGAFDATGNTAGVRGSGTFTTQGATTVDMAATNGGELQLFDSKAWVNSGTITVAGDDSIRFTGFTNTSSLTNAAAGVINLNSSAAIPINNFSGVGVLNNAGTLNQLANGSRALAGISINNTGTIAVSAGTLSLLSSGTDTGLYTVATGSTLQFGSGTRTMNAGSDVTGLGTLEVSGGTVAANGNLGILTTGTSLVASGGTLNIGNAASGAIVPVTISGGTANFNGTAAVTLPSLTMTGGTLGGTSNVTVSGAFNVTGSSAAIDGTGTFTTQGTSTINLANVVGGFFDIKNDKTWINTGNVTLGGDDYIAFAFFSGGTNTLTNAAGGTFNVSSTNTTPFLRRFGTAVFNNAGTLNKSATGAQSISFDTFAGTSFNNTGTVNVSAGDLTINANGTDTGAYNIASGTSLTFLRGVRDINTGSSFGGTGVVSIVGTGVSGATVNFNGTGTTTLPNLAMTRSTLGGTGDVTIAGNFDLSGTTANIIGSGTFTTQGTTTINLSEVGGNLGFSDSKAWVNTGAVNVGGDDSIRFGINGNSVLTNAAGGVFNFSSSNAFPLFQFLGTGTFNNAGTLNHTAVGSHSLSTTAFNNTGTIDLSAGNLTVNGAFAQSGTLRTATGTSLAVGASFINPSGSLITGDGNLSIQAGTGTLTNQGVIRPGAAGSSGTLTVTGNVALSTGTLEIDLGGTLAGQSDRLSVSGNLGLGGTLSANLLGSYNPANGDFVSIASASTSSGNFSSTTLPSGFTAGYALAAGEAARLIFSAVAGTRVFSNAAGDLNWASAANWGGAVPGVLDTALISAGFSVVHGSGTDTVTGLTVNGGNALTVSGGSLNVTGATALGGTLTTAGTGSLTLGGSLTGTGTVLAQGGTLTLNGTSVMNSLQLTGGTLNGSGSLQVNSAFSRSSNSLVGSGFSAVNITQASGALQVRDWTAGSFSLSTLGATAGDVLLVSGPLVSTVGNLTLSAAGSVAIQAPGGSLAAAAGDINITASSATLDGSLAAQRIRVTAAGALQITSGGLSATSAIGDSIVLSAGTFQKSLGSSALAVAGGARWLVYSSDPGNDTTGSLAAAFRQYNAVSGVTPVVGAGNGLLYSLAPTIAATLQGSAAKPYDGTVVASLSNVNYTLSGSISGDTISLAGTPTTGTYADKNVGLGKLVQASGLSISAADAISGIPVFGYGFSGSAVGSVGVVTPLPLPLTGLGPIDKVYDGTTLAQVSGTAGVAPIGGDNVSLLGAATARFSDKVVGQSKPVTFSGLTLSGTDAGNYVLQLPTLAANITPASILLTGTTAANKVYDGNTIGTFTSFGTFAALAGDAVALGTGGVATFSDKSVGVGKTVAIAGLALTGADAGNYTLVAPAAVSANISARALIVSGLTALSRTYDSTTTATLSGAGTINPISGDNVTLAGSGSAIFSDKNTGTAKPVTVVGFNLTGSDAGNYLLAQPGGLSANITPASVPLTGLVAQSKVYDAGTAVNLVGTATVTPLGSDALSLVGTGVGRFNDKSVGNAKPVPLSGLLLAGADAGNYTLVVPTLAANITPAALGLTGLTAGNKVYDSTRTAVVNGSLSGLLGGDTVNLGLTGQFNDVNVGNAKTVSWTANSDGPDAGNYLLTPSSGTLQANIAPALLTYTASSAVGTVGQALPFLTGTVTGFQGADTRSIATTGGLVWSTNASSTSSPGAYAVAGTGLSALNYVFAQAANNTSALILTAPTTADAATTATRVVTNAGLASVQLPLLMSTPTQGRVLDVTTAFAPAGSAVDGVAFRASSNRPDTAATSQGSPSVGDSGASSRQAGGAANSLDASARVPASSSPAPAEPTSSESLPGSASGGGSPTNAAAVTTAPMSLDQGRAFALRAAGEVAAGIAYRALDLSRLPREEVQTLLAARARYKQKIFAKGVFRLQIDPALADVRACRTEAELETGICIVTEQLKQEIQSAKAEVAQLSAPKRERLRRGVKVAALPVIERKLALVIGVNKYDDKQVPELMGAVPDARSVRQVLEARMGYETTVLENPSRESIVRAFNKLALEAESNDSVIVYYAGHGVLVPVEGVETGYWLPSDVDSEAPSTWLSNADIARMIGAVGAKQVMLVSDSCYSGQLVGKDRVQVSSPNDASELLKRRAAVVMSSGGDEPVADQGREGHSVFAWHFMRALEGLTQWQVGGSLYDRVRAGVVKDFPQTPQYGANRGGGHQGNTDYLFERRELEAQNP